MAKRFRRLVAAHVLHFILHREKCLSLPCVPAKLCPDLVGRTGQLRVSLGSFLAAFRNQFGAVGRIGINQLLLLRHLRLVAGDELFLLQLRTDAIGDLRSEEHTSELQSLMRISYAVFCLKKQTVPYEHSHYASLPMTPP